jgi:hypothetical protein
MEYSSTVPFPYNVVSLLKSSPIQLRFRVGEQSKLTRSHVGKIGSLSNHRNVVFGREIVNQLRGMSWSFGTNFADSLRMAKSSVKMECTDPVLIPTSSASSRTVTRRSCMTKVRTCFGFCFSSFFHFGCCGCIFIDSF